MWLPKTAFQEVRYYQPLEQKRALHHDFFAVPAGGRFYFVFDTSLSAEQRCLLETLLGRLRYFGRAESRAVLRIRDDLTGPGPGFFRVTERERADGTTRWTPRRVLCPSADRDFRASDLWTSRQSVASGKKAKKPRAVAGRPGMPVHLVDVLLSERKPLPDGARWIEYALPDRSVVDELPRVRSTQPTGVESHVEVREIGLRLCRRVPIPLAEAVAVARAYRSAAVRSFEAATAGAHSRTLTGREEDGSMARGHRHLYYLPQPEPGRLELTALLIRVPVGVSLRQEELDALMSVEHIVLGADERYPITVVPEHANGNALIPARRWRSVTPFLPPHQHRRGRAVTVPELQLASCLEESCGVAPIRTNLARGPGGAGVRTPVRAHDYAANPSGARRAPSWKLTRRLAHWFTVDFDRPVVLTVPVGADAHFGLGQFGPIEEE